MKFKRNLLILSAVLIGVLIVVAGCVTAPTTPSIGGDVPSGGSVSIAHAAATTNDATPLLTISATGATYMAFSGNGTTWSSWVAYATSHSTFNITTGEGCTTGEGTKTVYVKFKNDAGESLKYNDTVEYDITKPKLSTAVYSDANSSSTVNKGDTITFTFDDGMLKSTVTSTNVATSLLLSTGSYGTGATISWNTTGTICTVILGTSPTIVYGTTVNPASSVADAAGNADDSSAVTISGLLNILASVSIAPSAAATTTGGATVTLTATALSTAGSNITSSCTLTWTITGIGTISPTTGSSTVYTPPSSGTGTAVITVTAVYAGVTKTGQATITVSAGATVVDPAKLFVSFQNQNAKYTSLPAGATVKVYSNATNNAGTAALKVTITSNNSWTGASVGILVTDYIFFTVIDSGGWTSPMTADGQIPTAPDGPGAGTALESIQATSKNTVTSSVAGFVTGNDKITLYVGGIAYSAATSVGSLMTVAPDLVAGNVPTYTRTNPDGHESAVSGADGLILILTTAGDGNGGVGSTLDSGDTLTLSFGGNVDVNVPITVFNISWVASAATAALDNGTGTLAGTSTSVATVVLTATANCTDFAGGETVAFNILTTTPIVDTTGGNQVLPAAAAIPFDATDF